MLQVLLPLKPSINIFLLSTDLDIIVAISIEENWIILFYIGILFWYMYLQTYIFLEAISSMLYSLRETQYLKLHYSFINWSIYSRANK